jgi:hypothetical protein
MQVGQLLGTLNFMDFLERGHGAVEAGPNLLDKLQIAMARGEGPISVLPVLAGEREILTVSDASSQGPGRKAHVCTFCIEEFFSVRGLLELNVFSLVGSVQTQTLL